MTFDVQMLINKKGATHTNKYPSHAPTKIEQHEQKTARFFANQCKIEKGRES